MLLQGRRPIFTDVVEVNSENVIQILRDAEPTFTANSMDCARLLDIEKGNLPLTRVKQTRTDIDVKTNDSIAHEITAFKEGYHWSNVINLVQRGHVDTGKSNESQAITMLNECYSAENIGEKQNELGHYVEICGVGYTLVDIKTDWEEGDSYFDLITLDPRCTFVVRSSYYADHRIMIAGTWRTDSMGLRYYTVFSKDRRYEISQGKVTNGKLIEDVWQFGIRNGELNPIPYPITEYRRSVDMMGVFEREIPEMERLNLIISDIGNDIDQETQMIWWTNDVEFPEIIREDGTTETKKPVSNEWVQTYTSADGKSPNIKPLVAGYDYAGLLANYKAARTLILQRTYTPQRNDDSGGSTGVAMSDATGWSAAEQVAASQQLLTESAKMCEVKAVLQAIKKNPHIEPDNPMLDLKYMDVKPNIMRQKTYEMTVKTTALANLLSHGIYGLHALKSINYFDDVAQVWEDSKDLIEEYQKTTFGEKEENDVQMSSDLPEYQIGNSPLIDGMSVQQEDKEAENVSKDNNYGGNED